MIEVTVNGENREVASGTVTGLLATHNLNPKMVVVEHNGEILSRDSYGTTILSDGDNLEIVQMMAGG